MIVPGWKENVDMQGNVVKGKMSDYFVELSPVFYLFIYFPL
jgi:hypothetical protein